MGSEGRWRRLAWVVPLVCVVAAVLVVLRDPLPLQVLRHAAFDQYQRWQPRVYEGAPVRIVDIDDASLSRHGQWPWPRTRMAELVERLQAAGAAVVAFDVMFAEPDRTSPAAMLELWRPPRTLAQHIGALPDHDAAFASAIAKGNVVLGFAVAREGASAPPPIKARYVTLGEPPQAHLDGYTSSVASLPVLAAAADGLGALTFVPDADGVVRRVPMVVRQDGALLPSLTAEALRVAQGASNYTVRAGGSGAGLTDIRIAALNIPTTPQGEVWVHYTRPVPARYVPAWKVLAGEADPGALAGHIVLVGTSAQGLMDLRFSPLGGVIPGVEVHAQAIEQLLAGRSLLRPGWAAAAQTLAIAVGGLAIGAAAIGLGALASFGVFMAFVIACAWSAWHAYTAHGWLLDPLAPALAFVATFVLSTLLRHFSSERRHRWIKRAFSRYVSPNLVNYLIEHPGALQLGGHRRQCSFVFTDLEGFTPLIEKLDAQQSVGLLNDYIDGMVTIAFRHEGTLDRIVGDSVAIMFSAPVAQEDHQRRAVACALDMQRFAARYADDLRERGVPFCRTRIGVHTGEVTVGNFGGAAMFDYRALGDAVNTASRLESANKQLGTLLCVSQATLAGCPDVPARPIGRVQLAGRSTPVMVYEPLDPAVPEHDATAYREAYEMVRDGRAEAGQRFERLRQERPHDALVKLHLARMRAGQRGDLIVLDGK